MAHRRVFDHVLVIMFENQYRGYVMENDYFRRLARQGIDLANMHGVMHPSQTNYIASVAGELCNVTDDDPPPPLEQQTIVDLVEQAGLTWKAYMDGYSPQAQPWSAGFQPENQGQYVVKHNPFASFASIIDSEERWARVVPASQLWIDLQAGTLPEYCWFTPDLWNDGHYLRGTSQEANPRAPALVDQAAEWLEWFFGTLRFPGPDSMLPPRTLVVVTYDEADFEQAWDAHKLYTYEGPNQIYTVLLGDVVTRGVETEGYNHYSLIRTIEENFGLGSLGKNDADSNWFRFLWGERFAWGEPQNTPVTAMGGLAAAGVGDALHVISATDAGLVAHTWDGAAWSAGVPLPFGGDDVAAASDDEGLAVVAKAEDGRLVGGRWVPGTGWVEMDALVDGPVASFALSRCDRGAGLMLAYADGSGAITSRRFCDGKWEDEVATGHVTRGWVRLAELGHTLLLLFAGPGSTMQAASYNTAPYNVVTPHSKYAGDYDDTTVDAWSPSAWPVGLYAATTTPADPFEPEPHLLAFKAGSPPATGELDGTIHVVHRSAHRDALVEERFSVAGLLTPKLPVSYRNTGGTTNDGYGTLAEAGWSPQAHLALPLADGGHVALAGVDGRLVLLFQPEPGPLVRMVVGGYAPPPATAGA